MCDEEEFNKELLPKYINDFLGYGNLKAKYWFVGEEENGGCSICEVNALLDVWNDRGRKNIEDMICVSGILESIKPDYRKFENFFGKETRDIEIQPVWGQIIKLLLSYKDNINLSSDVIDENIIKDFQKNNFGRGNGEIFSMNLFPLPFNKSKGWIYGSSEISCLNTNSKSYKNKPAKYVNKMLPYRIGKIKDLIKKHNPEFVNFYCYTYKDSIKDEFDEVIFCNIPAEVGIAYKGGNKKISFYIGNFNKTTISISHHSSGLRCKKEDKMKYLWKLVDKMKEYNAKVN